MPRTFRDKRMVSTWESRCSSFAGGWTERQGTMWEGLRGAGGAMRGSARAGRLRGRYACVPTPGVCGVFLLSLALCAVAPPVRAQGDWVPELAPAQSETRGRSEPIVILLPADLDPATYERLAVELDDLDVTAFVTVEAGSLTLLPPRSEEHTSELQSLMRNS